MSLLIPSLTEHCKSAFPGFDFAIVEDRNAEGWLTAYSVLEVKRFGVIYRQRIDCSLGSAWRSMDDIRRAVSDAWGNVMWQMPPMHRAHKPSPCPAAVGSYYSPERYV